MYWSKYAVCPYYSRNDDNRICCEGTDSSNTINLVFGDRKKQKEYEQTYCNSLSGHKRCMICKALDDKYGVKHEE